MRSRAASRKPSCVLHHQQPGLSAACMCAATIDLHRTTPPACDSSPNIVCQHASYSKATHKDPACPHKRARGARRALTTARSSARSGRRTWQCEQALAGCKRAWLARESDVACRGASEHGRQARAASRASELRTAALATPRVPARQGTRARRLRRVPWTGRRCAQARRRRQTAQLRTRQLQRFLAAVRACAGQRGSSGELPWWRTSERG